MDGGDDPNIFIVEENSPSTYEIRTLLHHTIDSALSSGDLSQLRELLRLGANPLIPDGDGEYPLELLLAPHVADPLDAHAPSLAALDLENAVRAELEDWSRRAPKPLLSLERGVARVLLLRAVVLGDAADAGELRARVGACEGDVDFAFLCDAFYPDEGWVHKLKMAPLHRAVLACQIGVDVTGETVQALLEAGADRNVRDGRGLTPLELAKRAMGFLKAQGKLSDFHMFYGNGEFGLQAAIELLENE